VHGHTIGAAGAIELIVTISALAEQTIPPTINWTAEEPNCALDAVPNVKRSGSFTAAMSNSFVTGRFRPPYGDIGSVRVYVVNDVVIDVARGVLDAARDFDRR
jgi:hypothetical protein